LKAIEKGGWWWEVKGLGRVMEGVEWTKLKVHLQWAYIETPLNINLNINNENQDCKIGSVCGGY
jgi:hypothetical protein